MWRMAAGAIGMAFSAVLGFPAEAADLLVEKKTFELAAYTTVGGRALKNVKIGWQSAGTLNAEKSNAILITHYFSGTSHAFGKYTASDPAPGYWDAIIGPGKAIDTNQYFVIASDTLVNLNANAPNVVTTGPASVDPETGKPYGMTFPIVTIKDFVNVQEALVRSLGIFRLRAVVGASMGALQAYEWAASYPDMVERIVPVIGVPAADPFLVAWLDIWAQPIRVDPKWKNGDYAKSEPPLDGLKAALKVITLHANQSEWATMNFGLAPAEAGKDPAQAMANRFKIEAALDAAGAARAATSDANHLLYLAKANQLAAADVTKIKAPVLLLSSPTDLVFPPRAINEAVDRLRKAGVSVETGEITGPNGHLNGVLAISQQGDRIASFLVREVGGSR